MRDPDIASSIHNGVSHIEPLPTCNLDCNAQCLQPLKHAPIQVFTANPALWFLVAASLIPGVWGLLCPGAYFQR